MFIHKGFILCPDSNWFPKLISPWNMLYFKDHIDYKHILLCLANLTYFSQVVIHFLYGYLQKFLKEHFKILRNFYWKPVLQDFLNKLPFPYNHNTLIPLKFTTLCHSHEVVKPRESWNFRRKVTLNSKNICSFTQIWTKLYFNGQNYRNSWIC